MNNIFTNEEIVNILSSDKVCNYNNITITNNFNNLYLFFKNIKISNKEIKKIILDYPRILTYSINNLKDNYNNLSLIFKENTNKLIISNIRILIKDISYIKDKFNYFKQMNIDNDTILRMFISFPNLLILSKDNINSSLDNLNRVIKDNYHVLELFKSNPRIVSYDINKINEKTNWFINKGYSSYDIIKILTKSISILSLDYNYLGNMDNKYDYLLNVMGYKNEQIIYITTLFPNYYTLSNKLVIDRLDNLNKLLNDKRLVKIIFYKFPSIISLRSELINEKYEFYSKLDMLDIFINDPKYLMQSIELTKKRYEYLINKNIKVDNTCYKKLFLSNKKFKESYGMTNEILMKEGVNDEKREFKRNIR